MNLILLRGLAREARHWGALAGPQGVLAQHLAAVHLSVAGQVLAIDLPGNGRFHAMPAPHSVGKMVDLARAQLLANGFAPPYALVAMSLGGRMATDWAQRYPQEILRLVLINTSMRPYSGLHQRLRPTSWPTLLRLGLNWPGRRAGSTIEKLIFNLTCQRRDSEADDIADWSRIRQQAPVSLRNALRQFWAAAQFRSAAEPPPCRTLLLSGACDALVDPQCSADIAFNWRAGHYQHPWAGHDLPHDDPEWVGARIAGWLAQK